MSARKGGARPGGEQDSKGDRRWIKVEESQPKGGIYGSFCVRSPFPKELTHQEARMRKLCDNKMKNYLDIAKSTVPLLHEDPCIKSIIFLSTGSITNPLICVLIGMHVHCTREDIYNVRLFFFFLHGLANMLTPKAHVSSIRIV